MDGIEELAERQLVVHFEVMPQVSDEADLLCGDVRVLDSLVLTAEDGSTNFTDDVTASTNVNLSLPVGINMNDLLNGTLEVVPQTMPSSVPIMSAEEAAQIQRGKIKIPALKRPPRKSTSESNDFSRAHEPISHKRTSVTAGDDAANLGLQFEQWLASATEKINQTMHFGMSGTPEPLVYEIPHSFFEFFRERISSGGRKKRLPNNTIGMI